MKDFNDSSRHETVQICIPGINCYQIKPENCKLLVKVIIEKPILITERQTAGEIP